MPLSLKPLAEQIIVITGASSGIGLATAHRAARAGANVVLAARNEEALKQAVADIEEAGGKAAFCAVDMADADAAERIGAIAFDRFGGFDSWVNNAAVAMFARVADVSPAEHRRIFDVGYFGLVAASLYAVEQLKTKGGALINIGSVLSDRAVPVQGNYAAMKAAVKSFTDTLRMETAMEKGRVSITLIKPNGIDTPYPEHARNRMGKPARIPPMVYDPELVAKAICHCAEHPRREILVGGQGAILTRVADLIPGATDIGMELLMGENAQSIDKAPEPGAEDNLFAPRADGRMRSNGRHGRVRKSSLALEAQLHPVAAGLAGIAAAGAAFAFSRLAAQR
jgi:short-subunit dehydrogenase